MADFSRTLVVLGQVGIGVGVSRWQVGQAPVQSARRVCSSRTMAARVKRSRRSGRPVGRREERGEEAIPGAPPAAGR
jgi:hypothetical protein